MKILFVNAYFYPETIAFSCLEKNLIEGIVDAGHELEVICPIPTRGITDETYRQYKSIKTETLYGERVYVRRFYAPREGRNPLIRAFRYFWCNFREYQIGKKCKNIDVLFATSTPPTQGLFVGRLSKKLKCPFIYGLQDIFPDSLVTTGLSSKGSILWKIGTLVERKTYQLADKIVIISKSCKQNLLQKGVAEEKISLISNWSDLEKIHPVSRAENTLINELKIDPLKFLVVYAGNFGAAQGAEIVLKVAEVLIDKTEIQFVIFGGGTGFLGAVEYVEQHHLTNVIIRTLLPQERVSEVYSLGDVALITCKAGVGNSGMPSKLWNIMACNTPIIASFDIDSDVSEILKESGAGVCVEPENVNALADEIRSVFSNRQQRQTKDLRSYAKSNADKAVCVARYLEIFQRTIK